MGGELVVVFGGIGAVYALIGIITTVLLVIGVLPSIAELDRRRLEAERRNEEGPVN